MSYVTGAPRHDTGILGNFVIPWEIKTEGARQKKRDPFQGNNLRRTCLPGGLVLAELRIRNNKCWRIRVGTITRSFSRGLLPGAANIE